MRYEAPLLMGSMTLGPVELVLIAAVVSLVVAFVIGFRRDAAVFVGILGGLAAWVSQVG